MGDGSIVFSSLHFLMKCPFFPQLQQRLSKVLISLFKKYSSASVSSMRLQDPPLTFLTPYFFIILLVSLSSSKREELLYTEMMSIGLYSLVKSEPFPSKCSAILFLTSLAFPTQSLFFFNCRTQIDQVICICILIGLSYNGKSIMRKPYSIEDSVFSSSEQCYCHFCVICGLLLLVRTKINNFYELEIFGQPYFSIDFENSKAKIQTLQCFYKVHHLYRESILPPIIVIEDKSPIFFRLFSIMLSMLEQRRFSTKKNTLLGGAEENQFQRVRLLGQGTFGKVHLIINKRTKKQYALKEVPQHPQFRNRQLSILSQLSHYSIVEMKDYYFKAAEQETTLFILMEKMDSSLAAVLKMRRQAKKGLDVRVRKLISFQLIKGLAYLQGRNVCHRDLKPPNILLNTKTHEVKICDFGSAKVIEVKQNNIFYICSRYYRAPELILESTTYGCEIDMWSLGCIIVELMTCEPIFPGDSSIEQLIEISKILGTPAIEPLDLGGRENWQLPKVKGSDWRKILKRYEPEQMQVDLIQKILTYDFEGRIKPLDALKHPYFADLATFQESKHLPNLFEFQSLRSRKNRKAIAELQRLYEYYQQSYSCCRDQNDTSAE